TTLAVQLLTGVACPRATCGSRESSKTVAVSRTLRLTTDGSRFRRGTGLGFVTRNSPNPYRSLPHRLKNCEKKPSDAPCGAGHCEEPEATKQSLCAGKDCFAALAMTA